MCTQSCKEERILLNSYVLLCTTSVLTGHESYCGIQSLFAAFLVPFTISFFSFVLYSKVSSVNFMNIDGSKRRIIERNS